MCLLRVVVVCTWFVVCACVLWFMLCCLCVVVFVVLMFNVFVV